MIPGDVPSSDALAEEREALELMHSGQLELARHKLMLLSKKHPNVAKFHFNTALVLYKLKRFDDALDEVNAGLWLKPDDVKASNFKKEIINSRLKLTAVEAARIAAPEATNAITTGIASVPAGVQENHGDTGSSVTASLPSPLNEHVLAEAHGTDAKPLAPPDGIEQPPTASPAGSTSTPAIVTGSRSPGLATTNDEETITSSQPETLPAIPVVTSEPPPPSTEPEVMPALGMPSIPATMEHKNEIAPGHGAIAPIPGPGQETLKVAPTPASQPPLPAAETCVVLEKTPPTPAELPPSVNPPGAEPAMQPPVEHESPDKSVEAPVAKSPRDVLAVTASPPSPEVVASIPGPSVIESGTVPDASARGKSNTSKIIEVEPRITILEKTAEITIGVAGGQVAQGHVAPSTSTRLTNLKDLVRESRKAAVSPPELLQDAGTILPDTIELELVPSKARRPGEEGLVSFSSFKELDSYKFSIQALVNKLLTRKVEHEAMEQDAIDDSTPLVLEIESGIADKVPYEEADLPPHEGASVARAIPGDLHAPGETIPSARLQGASDAKTHDVLPTGTSPSQASLAAASLDQATSTSTSTREMTPEVPAKGQWKNVAGIQQPLVEILSTSIGHVEHHVEFDIATFVSASVMAKARVGKLVQSKARHLARVVDMETYATMARLKRAIDRGKLARMNALYIRAADEVIKQLEAGEQPVMLYVASRSDQEKVGEKAEEKAVDIETEIALWSSGKQQGLSDDALAKFIEYIHEAGAAQSKGEAGDDDAAARAKATVAKIKRVALDLYNNTQYEQAINIYTTLLVYFPEDFEALFNLGFCHRELGNYKDAEETFKHIIELFYDNAYAWYNLSVIYGITTEGAMEAYCLQRAREFGYAVDINRLSRLMVSFTPKNPFDP